VTADADEFEPSEDDPLRQAPAMDDMEARRARAAIEGRLFSGPAEPVRVGRYRIEGRIGAGGMGVVYRARDPELARDVAVKVMNSEGHAGKDEKTARARLVREARAMARLAHPNVIHVYDVGTVEDGVFIAMELVDGKSLASWRDAKARDWREVLGVCLDAGRGLAAAHAVGVVHRDFKPENVLVGADGRARVGDFGLAGGAVPNTGAHEVAPGADDPHLHSTDASAPDPSTSPTLDDEDGREALAGLSAGLSLSSSGDEDSELDLAAISGALTRTGMLLGTPKYMAPEQEVGGSSSPLADQFSFCVALYEALYGRPPYEGDSVATYRKHVHEASILPPPPDSRVKAWVHAEIVRGLSVDPDARHPSMEALIERLDAALADPSPLRRQRRKRRFALLTALALLGVGGSIAAAAVMAPGQDDDRAVVSTDTVDGVGTVDALAAADRTQPGASALEASRTSPAASGTTPSGESPSDRDGVVEQPAPSAPQDAASTNGSPAAETTPAPDRSAERPAVRRTPRRAGNYCYYERDSKDFIVTNARNKNVLRHGQRCLECGRAKNPRSLNSEGRDCRGFLLCLDAKDATACE